MPTKVTWLGHGTFSFEFGGQSLIVDPFFTGNPSASTTADKVNPAAIIISHGHGDHVGDVVSIAKRTGCQVISNYEISVWLEKQGAKNVLGMNPGGSAKCKLGSESYTVKLTVAHHSSMLPDGSNGGNPCGIVLKVPGGTVYHAADTSLFSDMKLIGEEGIDLAIVPIGDLYTMGPDDAVRAVKFIAPKRVIPDHYNTWPPIAQDAAAWAKKVQSATKAEPLVLKPGESCQLG